MTAVWNDFSSLAFLLSFAAPSIVPIMHQVSSTMKSITLSWPQPEQPNGIILDYELRYYEKVRRECVFLCVCCVWGKTALLSGFFLEVYGCFSHRVSFEHFNARLQLGQMEERRWFSLCFIVNWLFGLFKWWLWSCQLFFVGSGTVSLLISCAERTSDS